MTRRVELRPIETEADRELARTVELGPGDDRFVASVEESFKDAVEYAHAEPRMWTAWDGDELVGFVMLSDGVPAERLADDPTLVGP